MTRPKRPEIVYFMVGTVERAARTRGYQFHGGYSRKPDGSMQPWLTKREAQAEARAEGARAVFVSK